MGHSFEETIHNEDVEEQECVLRGLNTYYRYCPTLSMLGRFYPSCSMCFWACGSLDIRGMRGSHSMFHYERIR